MSVLIEERLRAALRARAEATDVSLPGRFVPSPLSRRRRPVVLAVAGLAAAAVVVGVVIVRQPHEPRSEQLHVTTGIEPQTTALGSPLPRVIIDLPALRPTLVEELTPTVLQENISGPGIDGFHIQSFRTAGALEGPLLWVLSMPPPPSTRNDYGFGVGRAVTVQGTTAWLQGGGPGYRLAWPGADGGGVTLTSLQLSEAELLAVANGLRPRQAGWNATVLPRGLAPDVDSPRRGVPGARGMDADYNGQGGSAQVSVATAGPTSFDERAMGVGIAPSVHAVAIAGEVGLLIHEHGRPNSWAVVWQPSPTTIAEVRFTGMSPEEVPEEVVRDALSHVRVVGEEEWLTTLPERTVRPRSIPGEVSALREGIPLPPDRAWDELQVPAVARDRQSLADQVSTWAVCAWNEEWRRATDAGDSGRADAAIAAIAASGAWPAAAAYPSQSSVAASRAAALTDQIRRENGIRACR